MGTIDWKAAREDAKAASILIPDGEFPFECVSADAQLSNGGAPQIVADFLCMNERYNKRTVRHWFTLSLDSPVALDIFFKTMKVFGMTEDYFAKGDGPEMEDVARRLLNQKVTCGVKTSEWNGQDRNKLSYFKKLTGAGATSGGAKKGAPTPRPAAKKAAPAPRPAAKATASTKAAVPDTTGDDDEPPF
jgi:hypothetical protein